MQGRGRRGRQSQAEEKQRKADAEAQEREMAAKLAGRDEPDAKDEQEKPDLRRRAARR